MANIKSGADIKEMCDVQNIISACILRAEQPSTVPELIQSAKKLCEGSVLKITDNQLREMVEGTIMAFRRINLVTACNGKYYAYLREFTR